MKLNDYERELLQSLADGKSQKMLCVKVGKCVISERLRRLRVKHHCETTISLIAKAFREKQIV